MKRAALLLLLAGCKHSERPKADSVVLPVATVAFIDAGPVMVPAPAPTVTGSKTREGAPGDTTLTISCGHTRCKAPQEYCVLRDGLWGCVDRDKAPTADRQYECDDVSDCPENGDDVCCNTDHNRTYCGYMAAADSEPCEFAACNTDQGAPSCPKGQSCVGGVCRPPPARATCAGKKQCPAETPFCLWQNGKGKCVTTATATEFDAGAVDISMLECTRPSDCGPGFTCCTSGGYDALHTTYCRAGCGQDSDVVCESSSECPPIFTTGINGGQLVPTACSKRQSYGQPLPAWAGQCQ